MSLNEKDKKVSFYMKELWLLFITFARIGGFTFGGGYAMLPILQREVVSKYKWVTSEELMDYYAIGQCTPGIIAINTATFIGHKQKGVIGGIFATLGMVAPSLVMITIISAFLEHFLDYQIVTSALAGIQVCVCALVLQAVISLGKKSVKDKLSIIIFIITLAVSLFTAISTAIIVIIVGIIGALVSFKSEVNR